LLDKVEVELGERGHALVARYWGPFEVLNVGFGQGIAVTPLQLANGYATLFNGGIYRPATILKVDDAHPMNRGRRVFTEATSYKMRSLLRLVAMKGTGKNADAAGYRVGGKTGTAQ
jgi:cell division protein FtsI (penicillin-binding protein 3)